jgi:hypothetical protein
MAIKVFYSDEHNFPTIYLFRDLEQAEAYMGFDADEEGMSLEDIGEWRDDGGDMWIYLGDENAEMPVTDMRDQPTKKPTGAGNWMRHDDEPEGGGPF